jgi:hypothetical protein
MSKLICYSFNIHNCVIDFLSKEEKNSSRFARLSDNIFDRCVSTSLSLIYQTTYNDFFLKLEQQFYVGQDKWINNNLETILKIISGAWSQ